MQTPDRAGQWWLGLCLLLGLALLGYQLSNAAIRFKQFERSVTVKGLSEREYPADIVIWPIQFTVAGNDLGALYDSIESGTQKISAFLTEAGVAPTEITVAPPVITDKSAQTYGGDARPEFRYSAMQNVTVYSANVDGVRKLMSRLSELGKQGLVFTGDNYQPQTQYLYTRLNEVKPEMVEEATRQAREVAEKFAADSQSTLGKIRQASQGQIPS